MNLRLLMWSFNQENCLLLLNSSLPTVDPFRTMKQYHTLECNYKKGGKRGRTNVSLYCASSFKSDSFTVLQITSCQTCVMCMTKWMQNNNKYGNLGKPFSLGYFMWTFSSTVKTFTAKFD